MNYVARVDVSATDRASRDFGRRVAARDDASQTHVQPHPVPHETARGLGTSFAAVVFLLLTMVVTPLALLLLVSLFGLVAGVVMWAAGAMGMMLMLGPVMLAPVIPAVIVAGVWWSLRHDSRQSVPRE